MAERVFLGWSRPFLRVLTEWLLARRDELPGMLVVVPTAQAGRLLREALAEAAGGLLAPKVVTPGHFLRTENAAPDAVELLAWVEVLESIRDWSPYAAAFPLPPGEGESPGWALGLAKSLAGVRKNLQENALLLIDAARRLGKTVEGERWEALADLEAKVELQLKRWRFESRSRVLARGGDIDDTRRVVLAGVPDFPAAVARHLSNAIVLIGAPESEAGEFDELGRPIPEWAERRIAWPQCGSVTLTADPRQQAAEAMRLAAAAGTPSDELALGSADEATAGELVRAFGRGGWVLHDPAHLPPAPLKAWLATWRQFVSRPDAAAAIDLLGFVETGALTGGKRAQRVVALSAARDQWLARDRDDLQRITALNPRNPEAIQLAEETLEALHRHRGVFLREGIHAGLARMLERVDPGGEHSAAIFEWLDATASVATEVRREAGFWIDVLCSSLPEAAATAPEDRVLDVQGWLELFHEPGKHLIICGMNEGLVPGRASTDAWLPEGTRKLLGLSNDAARHARDAYLLTAMMEVRRTGGRVDLLLAKAGSEGDVLLPSRLLLAAEEAELHARVKQLFHEIEPPDSSLAWTLDEAWKWQPPAIEKELRISVTTFADYLACPFRFYLKYVAGMSEPAPERVEWNQRDFGNVAHIVVERWALDDEAKDFSRAEAIEAWVHEELDRVIAERFGQKVPLAVRIQRESMRQRLSWFAGVQACQRSNGWRIAEVEKKFELDIEGVTIVGRVDRIERHDDGRRRVLDYKTGTTAGLVEGSHRTGIIASTRFPAHLENVPQILSTGGDGKPKRWKNLQVPLYAAALGDVDELGYFQLGATEGDVKLSLWEGFSIADRDSALACARWVVGQVKNRVFWPPAEKVDFDDYAVLALGRSLDEAVARKGGAA
ncbi:PD-(D/E)XK nuclease family protein [Luteolibacter arcticus]|uniref:PD-(D/E)XK nuclease family protein n=1 Tax=Luteolibacter arcticus TaxID=1581411 RepID=A0ABT3GM42_9BACT|nr:PD-(D/E)XK nuclease family protein [Luteolibacter arcticus]MCW1924557.1 PD-(D/E)XK nuclease family protein [Luteolibacter arcticus]